jgi:hypothetical protein
MEGYRRLFCCFRRSERSCRVVAFGSITGGVVSLKAGLNHHNVMGPLVERHVLLTLPAWDYEVFGNHLFPAPSPAEGAIRGKVSWIAWCGRGDAIPAGLL